MKHADTLLAQYPIISDQVDKAELQAILRQLEGVIANGPDGAVVEFGCYVGTTSLFIRRLLDRYNDERLFHVYDSFQGLPDKSAKDASPVGEQFKAGELAVSKKQFIHEFTKAHLRLPIIHKGWFSDLSTEDVPGRIAFAFLDGDYYDSVRWPLRLIEDRLAPGAVIVIDDYANEALPGAARATDEWCQRQGYQLIVHQSLAIIHMS